ncbi:MAG: GtrA family protein [Bacteroidota bacterium]
MNRQRIKELFQKKFRYAIGGAIATAVDYLIYFGLYEQGVEPTYAQIPAYSVGMIVNFLIQKYFVFELNRSVRSAFLMSVLVSLGGLVLSTALIYLFNKVAFLQSYQLLIKLMTTGLVFFYNFYCKRYVFEKRFL